MIHVENKRRLLIEVFKCTKGENPPLLNGLFTRKEILVLPKASTKTWGLHSFAYRGSRAWNTLPDNIKSSHSSKEFKAGLKNIGNLICTCKLCIKE